MIKSFCIKNCFANSPNSSQTICMSDNDVPQIFLLIGVPSLFIVAIISKYTQVEVDRLMFFGWLAFMLWLWSEAIHF